MQAVWFAGCQQELERPHEHTVRLCAAGSRKEKHQVFTTQHNTLHSLYFLLFSCDIRQLWFNM